MKKTAFVYPIYIATTPEKLWEALTSGEFTKKYHFGCQVQSDWQEGSTVEYLLQDGRVTDHGIVHKCEPLHLLSFTWNMAGDETPRDHPTRVTFELQPMDGSTVKLTLKHEELLETDFVYDDNTFKGLNNGWPAILSNLKSLLETGRTLPPIYVDRENQVLVENDKNTLKES
ncbi:SRPBCC family protein [Peribacillus sp. NJ4]|uniref:SRPBCC family protein n=1 Tax=Peribacillus sp. NJ4 TaxID=3055862 RepID=UPI0025A04DCD|nr:SRPBCC family protein [Peribacillus sp. NJ4]MDM5211208.1 SRPBCC family protein [Peribacillus sp. NJ4]